MGGVTRSQSGVLLSFSGDWNGKHARVLSMLEFLLLFCDNQQVDSDWCIRNVRGVVIVCCSVGVV